jgi:hypothetical protein
MEGLELAINNINANVKMMDKDASHNVSSEPFPSMF